MQDSYESEVNWEFLCEYNERKGREDGFFGGVIFCLIIGAIIYFSLKGH